jgi:hypothetical protein
MKLPGESYLWRTRDRWDFGGQGTGPGVTAVCNGHESEDIRPEAVAISNSTLVHDVDDFLFFGFESVSIVKSRSFVYIQSRIIHLCLLTCWIGSWDSRVVGQTNRIYSLDFKLKYLCQCE